MRGWRNIVGVGVAALGLLAGCALPGPTRSEAPVTITLIGINDFHGHLLPGGDTVPVADRGSGEVTQVPAGGAAYLAGLLRTLRAANPQNTLLVAAGDLVGASPLASGLFHDEPTIEALNEMGLVVSSVGNHEFDKGFAELQRLQSGGCFPRTADGRHGLVGVDTCLQGGRFAGANFRYLGANVIERGSGKHLLPATLIREVAGVRIGFIGVTLKETAALTRGPGERIAFADEVDTVNALIPELRRQQVAFVVLLLHQGGTTQARAINDPSCPGFSGPVLDIVDRLDPLVQVVISGHTHEEYVCFRPSGRLVTQAGNYGRMATRIDLRVDPASGEVLDKRARTYVAANDGGTRDAAIDALVQRTAAHARQRAEAVVGRLAAPLLRAANPAGERPLGDVLADAYLFGGRRAAPPERAAQIAFVNPGGIRGDLSPGPDVNYGQLYGVHPFGNTLVTLELSGEQLRRVLEQQWEAPQPAGGRVLSVSAGFSYAWDAAQPAGAPPGQGRRVVPGSIRLNGVPLEPERRYRVTVNSFLAAGGDHFSVFADAREPADAGADLDVVSDYLRANTPVRPPALDRIIRVR